MTGADLQAGHGSPGRWVPPPLPDDPRKRRRIAVQLAILAVLGLVALILSAVTR
jgi:hypothetical protein